MEPNGMELPWAQTYKVPALNGRGTLQLFNYMIRHNLVGFLLSIPGIGGYEVLEFKPMADRFFITVVVKDKILSELRQKVVAYEFVVSHYVTLGIFLKSESWFLS